MKNLTYTLFALLLFTACAQEQTDIQERADVTEVETETRMNSGTVHNATDIEMATAVIHPTEGNSAEGVITFTQTNEGIRVEANISGLSADALHGFHIHEYGDCRADDGTSAGGHYNPQGMDHGAPTDSERHIGDLGNLSANSDGVATLDYVDPVLSFSGANSIIGYGVIVHAGEDDFVTQPTGDAGGRIGCGVIGVANSGY